MTTTPPADAIDPELWLIGHALTEGHRPDAHEQACTTCGIAWPCPDYDTGQEATQRAMTSIEARWASGVDDYKVAAAYQAADRLNP